MTAPSNYRVSIAHPDEIRASREAWNALVADMRQPSVFLGWEWLMSWIETWSAGYRLQVLYVRDPEARLVAILPLASARRRAAHMAMKAQVTTICGSLEAYPDHLDLICAKHRDGASILDACFAFLEEGGLLGDVLYLPYLAAEGVLANYLRSPAAHRFRAQSLVRIPALWVDLALGYESYLGAMSKKKRYNLMRERKILCEDKQASLVQVSSPEELGTAVRDLLRLHAQRADDLGRASNFAGDTTAGFHQLLASRLMERNQVSFYQLRVGDQPIATVYGFRLGNEFSFFQAGFDPQWKKLSPGKALIGMVLERLAAEGVVVFDFLGGGDEYKQFWATGDRPMESFLAFADNGWGKLNRLALRLRQFAKSLWLRARARPAAS